MKYLGDAPWQLQFEISLGLVEFAWGCRAHWLVTWYIATHTQRISAKSRMRYFGSLKQFERCMKAIVARWWKQCCQACDAFMRFHCAPGRKLRNSQFSRAHLTAEIYCFILLTKLLDQRKYYMIFWYAAQRAAREFRPGNACNYFRGNTRMYGWCLSAIVIIMYREIRLHFELTGKRY